MNFPDEYFDLVTCMGVLEHIPRYEEILKETYRILKQQGLALFLVPNSESPYFWFSGTGQIYEHPRTLKEWETLFTANDFSIQNMYRDPGPSWNWKATPTKKMKMLMNKLMNILPLRWTYQFNFIMKKTLHGHHTSKETLVE